MFDLYQNDLAMLGNVERGLVHILIGKSLPEDRAMPALELLLWTCSTASRGGPADELPCDGLPFEHIVAKLRTSTLNAYGDFHVRFRKHYESLPPGLTMIVVAKPRATAAAVIEGVVRQFAVAQPCCIGRYFGRGLQPAFQKAVADAKDSLHPYAIVKLCQRLGGR